MALKKGGSPWTDDEKRAASKTTTPNCLMAWNKLDAAGEMDGYEAYIGFDEARPNHIAVIRAFRDAARNIADCGIIPTTVGIAGFPPAHLKNNPVGFEFCVTSDVSAAQGKTILAEVQKKTGAALFIQ
jgi:hypothetical protein